MKSANRLLAIAFGAVWFFPAYRLLDLPHRRAVNLANVVREQLKSADQDPIPAQNLRPYYSLESPLPREDALRIVAHPEGYELAAWLAWVIEAILLGVGACGIACLWWRPRYWRFGVIAGVMAFTATSHLYSFAKQFWTRLDLWVTSELGGAFYTVHVPTGSARTLAFFSVATLIVVLTTIYTLLQREGAKQDADQ